MLYFSDEFLSYSIQDALQRVAYLKLSVLIWPSSKRMSFDCKIISMTAHLPLYNLDNQISTNKITFSEIKRKASLHISRLIYTARAEIPPQRELKKKGIESNIR